MDPVIMGQHLQDLTLRMLGRLAAKALGLRWGGQTGFNPSAEFHGMERTRHGHQRFVKSPPDHHGAKQRRHGGAMLAPSTRGLFLPP
jgi:hypothetical protein